MDESLLVVVTSSADALKFASTSASMASISSSLRELVTVFETSKVAINPVIEGVALGIVVVGAVIGGTVGLAVTNAAQQYKKFLKS